MKKRTSKPHKRIAKPSLGEKNHIKEALAQQLPIYSIRRSNSASKAYIYSLISMHCTKIITYLYINAGILQLLCKGKAVQKYLTLGTKIDQCDIAITDDTIIS